jgi:hypothetical protein
MAIFSVSSAFLAFCLIPAVPVFDGAGIARATEELDPGEFPNLLATW